MKTLNENEHAIDYTAPEYVAQIKASNPESIRTVRCAFGDGCRATIEATKGQMAFGAVPGGWVYMGPQGLPEGWYCPGHADAIEVVTNQEDQR